MMQRLVETAGYNAVVKGKYGYVAYNKNDIYIGRAVERYGEFSEVEAELFKQVCHPGDVAVEVGANIGTHTMVLAGLVGNRGRVFAFEPQRIVYYTLCANMALNSIENVYCYHLAAGAAPGSVLLPSIRYDVEGNFGGVVINQYTTGETIQVVKLDDFVQVPRLKLLKVDVEGMESEVINGARGLIARHRPVIYVENDRIEKSKDLIELIRSLHYRLFWHFPPLYNPKNFAGDSENIYANTVSINMFCVHESFNAKMEGFSEITDADFHPLKKQPA